MGNNNYGLNIVSLRFLKKFLPRVLYFSFNQIRLYLDKKEDFNNEFQKSTEHSHQLVRVENFVENRHEK